MRFILCPVAQCRINCAFAVVFLIFFATLYAPWPLKAETKLLDCDIPNGLIYQVYVVNQAGTLMLREFAKGGEIFQRELTAKEWDKKAFRLTIKRANERASLYFEQRRWRYWLTAPSYNAQGEADCDHVH